MWNWIWISFTFLTPNFDWGKNRIIFGVDVSSSVHNDNKNKDISILGEWARRGLDNTTLTAETKYSINYLKIRKIFCLSLHYNGSNSFLFLNSTKINQFKGKDFEIKRYHLDLENISKDFSVDNMKKTELNGYVFVFFVDYNIIDASNIISIYKYLMKNMI